jgi:hypothetical protein
VTEARPQQQFGKQRREIFKAFWSPSQEACLAG